MITDSIVAVAEVVALLVLVAWVVERWCVLRDRERREDEVLREAGRLAGKDRGDE